MGQAAEDCDAAMEAREGYHDVRQLMGIGGSNNIDNMKRIQHARQGVMLLNTGSGTRLVNTKEQMLAQYAINATAAVNTMIKCACCGKDIKKMSYQQKFCKAYSKGKSSCKDVYWNVVDAVRAERANAVMESKGLT